MSTDEYLPSELWSIPIVFLVPQPEFAHLSNGIRVVLDAALEAQSLGLNVCIVPSLENQYTCLALAPPFQALKVCLDIPAGSFAIIADTISPSRLSECRARCSRICHYALAPPGLFGEYGPSANRVRLLAGERQLAYSTQVSTLLPCFYLQSRFAELEPHIERSLRPTASKSRRHTPAKLRAIIYAGKGYIKPIPLAVRSCIDRNSSTLFTRHYPASKQQLYSKLAKAHLLISYDPISSLAYEASLLGIPTYVAAPWVELSFWETFPVRLDGLVWESTEKFLHILSNGFDHRGVVDSYREALLNNRKILIRLLNYAFVRDQSEVLEAEVLNNYWDHRQPFFRSMQLPSPSSAWGPIGVALPPLSKSDYIRDALVLVITSIKNFSSKLLKRFTRLVVRR